MSNNFFQLFQLSRLAVLANLTKLFADFFVGLCVCFLFFKHCLKLHQTTYKYLADVRVVGFSC